VIPTIDQEIATEVTETTEGRSTAIIDDLLTRKIIGAAIEVHRILGPGLLESDYEQALCHEFALRGTHYKRQAHVEMIKDQVIKDQVIKDQVIKDQVIKDQVIKDQVIKDQRIDLIVEDNGDRVVVDLKSLSRLPDVSTAQVLSYLKATGLKRGLLTNFGEKRLVDGVRASLCDLGVLGG
jgi:hypothetical protein